MQRGLLLLAALFPEQSYTELAQWSIGERDRQLFALREQLFGAQVASLATCPRCSETLEINFSLADVRVPVTDQNTPTADLVVQAEGYQVTCRLPNSADLLAITGLPTLDEARRVLAQRCMRVSYPDGQATSVLAGSQLPAAVLAEMTAQMASADPQADVQLALVCPACAERWSAQFDIVTFLWAEITAWAQRSLREVHVLAAAYGWRETDILALSAQRRQIYLQLIGA